MITIRDIELEAENGCSAFDAADQLRDYVYGLTRQAFAHSKAVSVTNVKEAEQRRDFVRKSFLKAIGWPAEDAGDTRESLPLCASITGTLLCEGYRIEKIIFQSAPRVWVSANLYLPDRPLPDACSLNRQLSDMSSPGGPLSDTSYPGGLLSDTSSPGGLLSDTSFPNGRLPDTSFPSRPHPDAYSPSGRLPDASSLHGQLPDASSPNELLPAVLLVCGHDPLGKGAAEYQRACICMALAGIAALCMDSYGQGERSGYYEPQNSRECIGRCTREHDYAGFQCMLMGDSVAGYLLRDAMRAVDYLSARPDIDSSRIGITGNSGGGTLSVMMMIADDRLAAAAPGTFVTSREACLPTGKPQDNEQIWPGLTSAGIDHKDCLICMAPKPVLLLTAAHDFFPEKGTKYTYHWCRDIWKLYGREAMFQIYRDDCMHTYSEGMAHRAAAFFAEVFQVKKPAASSAKPFSPSMLHSPETLMCSSGGYLQNERNGRGIFAQNLEKYLERKTAPQQMSAFLREKIYRNRRPGSLFLRKTRETKTVLNLLCDSYLWEPQEGIVNHGFLFRERREKLPVTIALWRDGCRRLTEHYTRIREICQAGRSVLVLDITGMGMLEQRQFSAYTEKEAFYGAKFKLNADLLWLDDCLMALGCFDLLRCLDAIENLPDTDPSATELFTWGKYSLYGEIAASLDDRIRTLTCECPQNSFGEIVTQKYYDPTDISSFVLPGILKYGDICDIHYKK